jgi:hypothetical protein
MIYVGGRVDKESEERVAGVHLYKEMVLYFSNLAFSWL